MAGVRHDPPGSIRGWIVVGGGAAEDGRLRHDLVAARRAEGSGGDEMRNPTRVVEEAQHGGRPVEIAVAAAESAAGDEAAPGLADKGGVDEPRGVARREAE